MSVTDPQRLHDRLDALRVAIEGSDLSEAARQMTDYDAAVHGYIAATAPDAPVDVLQDLLARQDALLLRMRIRHDEIGVALRQLHRSGSASHAYAHAGVSP